MARLGWLLVESAEAAGPPGRSAAPMVTLVRR